MKPKLLLAVILLLLAGLLLYLFYPTSSKQVHVVKPGSQERLTSVGKPVEIKVRVEEYQSKVPVPGIYVELNWVSKDSTGGCDGGSTNEQGFHTFQVHAFERGSVHLNERFFSGRSFVESFAHRATIESKPKTTQSVKYDGKEAYEVVLQVPPELVISGVVLDPSGQPVPGAKIYKERCMMKRREVTCNEEGAPAGTFTTVSDEQGLFRFQERRGAMPMDVFSAFHEDFGLSDWYKPQLVPGGYPFAPLSLVLPYSAALEFEVVDGEGAPVPDLPLRVCETRKAINRRGVDTSIILPSLFMGNTNKEGKGRFVLPRNREYLLLDSEAYPFRVAAIDGKAVTQTTEEIRSVRFPIILGEAGVVMEIFLPQQALSGRVIDAWGDPINRARIYQGNRFVGCTNGKGKIVYPVAGTKSKEARPSPWISADLPIRMVKKGFQTREIVGSRLQENGDDELTMVLSSRESFSFELTTTPAADRAFLIDRANRGQEVPHFYGTVRLGAKLPGEEGSFQFKRVERNPYDLVIVRTAPSGGHEGFWIIENFQPTEDSVSIEVPTDLFTASLEGTVIFPGARQGYKDLCVELQPRYLFDLDELKVKKADYLKYRYQFPVPATTFSIPDLQPGIYKLRTSTSAGEGTMSDRSRYFLSEEILVIQDGQNRHESTLSSFRNRDLGSVVITAKMPDGRPADTFKIIYPMGNEYHSSEGVIQHDKEVGIHEFCITDEATFNDSEGFHLGEWNAVKYGEFRVYLDQVTRIEVQLEWAD